MHRTSASSLGKRDPDGGIGSEGLGRRNRVGGIGSEGTGRRERVGGSGSEGTGQRDRVGENGSDNLTTTAHSVFFVAIPTRKKLPTFGYYHAYILFCLKTDLLYPMPPWIKLIHLFHQNPMSHGRPSDQRHFDVGKKLAMFIPSPRLYRKPEYGFWHFDEVEKLHFHFFCE